MKSFLANLNKSGDFQKYILKTTLQLKCLKKNHNESSISIEEPNSKSSYSFSAKLPTLTLPKYGDNPMTISIILE